VNFAHALIEQAGVDLVHGHSSHHPKAIEVHQDKLILYGCGDLINDYEGISGYESYRGDLGFMYFPTLDGDTGRLLRLELVATQMHRFRLCSASSSDTRWLCSTLDREGHRFGTWAESGADQRTWLRWRGESAASRD
jgi:poly-gamma-glutamate synthesis protein (capsule biosynthesis protein)